jgi:beta-galactosidase
VVAYDDHDNVVEEKTVKTAGEPHQIELVPDRQTIAADERDLAYIHVRVVDKDGNLCPHDGNLIHFKVTGAGKYRASANGDPTCLHQFHLPEMPLFNGQLMTIIQAKAENGEIHVEATAKGLKKGSVRIKAVASNL